MSKLRISLLAVMTVAILLPMSFAAAVTPTPAVDQFYRGFEHGIVLKVDGMDYYLAGAPDGVDGAIDVPGHYWRQIGKRNLIGLHFNTGPFGAPQWWSSDADDGELLFFVLGRIDTWSPEKAEFYAKRGFVHYHEMLSVENGEEHPTKVIWLKHIALRSFNFDGGPHPEFGHYVTPGVDHEFMPNYMMPYP
jgi:selenium-binding protein 1